MRFLSRLDVSAAAFSVVWSGVLAGTELRAQAPPDCNVNGIADGYETARVYAGTQGGLGSANQGKAYRLDGDTWTWIHGNNSWPTNVTAVMDLIYFNGYLYAGVQTAWGFGGGDALSGAEGQVLRYDIATDA